MNEKKVIIVGNNGNNCEYGMLIANRYSRNNGMAVVDYGDRDLKLCGGHIIEDTEQNRQIIDFIRDNFDMTEPNAMFMALYNFRNDPYVKSYYEE